MRSAQLWLEARASFFVRSRWKNDSQLFDLSSVFTLEANKLLPPQAIPFCGVKLPQLAHLVRAVAHLV
jgi:hypothetical protein